MIKTIVNRDGTKANFEFWRIEMAIEKALHSCTGKDGRIEAEITSGNSIQSLSKDLSNDVKEELTNYLPGHVITVELIQDVVERILMKKGYYVVAKEYILYRDRHARIRKQFLRSKSAGFIHTMKVIKRDGNIQPMSRDKILKRIRRECEEHSPNLHCDPVVIAEKVADGVYDKVSTRELDELTITIAKNMVIQNPGYEKLAARIAISGHQKDTGFQRYGIVPGVETQIAFVAWSLFHNVDKNGDHSPLLQKELFEYILENQFSINDHISYERDFDLSIFGFQTLTRAYLMKALTSDSPERRMIERPQDMFMRVALGIHCVRPNLFIRPSEKLSDYEKRTRNCIDDYRIGEDLRRRRVEFTPDLEAAFQTYEYMSRGYFIHATPTLFYAGTTRPGLSSCFLLAVKDDSIEGIYDTLKDCALVSKNAGGIGLHIHKIRANQSYIRGTGGEGNGIVPMLKVFNDTAKYVDQGGGKRKGAFAIYLACWHADILDFLELKLPHGQEQLRSRDLFYAFWRNDYFMECVLEDRDWYLMCPDECPGLADVYGEDFVELYEKYVFQGKYRKLVKARDIYRAVAKSRVECGVPYIGEKDSINRKSNQSNLGTIQSSNLCVSGDTYILTKQFGQIPIQNIVDKKLEVWNGEEWSWTTVRKTGENKDLLRVVFSNGVELNCTPEHRFYLKGRRDFVEAKSLCFSDTLIDYELPKFGEVVPNPTIETAQMLAFRVNDLTEFFRLLRLQLQTQGRDSALDEKGLFYFFKDTHYSIRVIKVCEGRKGVDTYCFTEDKRHMGMFNGILTGQCTEIVLYSDPQEHGTCNLASIALPKFVKYNEDGSPYFDHHHLHEVAQIVTRNINKVIDRNYYPTPESERSNYRHRPIGIGVQGLWDVFMMLRMPFGNIKAIALDRAIFETIYHGSLTASWELALEEGPYSSFWYNGGCPLSKGKFQFDLWAGKNEHSGMWDWEELRIKVVKDGIRNSELTAPMPTASTSQILGWTECFESIKSNLYKRKTSSGEFIVLNKYLYEDIERLGLDVLNIREQIELNGGSIQKIEEFPEEMRELYKTVWDMDQSLIIDHCAARGPYVTQCCSMNLYFDVVDPEILMKVDIYSWMKGVKTQYYTHSRSLTKAKQHHSSEKPEENPSPKIVATEGPVCMMEEGCLMCGS